MLHIQNLLHPLKLINHALDQRLECQWLLLERLALKVCRAGVNSALMPLRRRL